VNRRAFTRNVVSGVFALSVIACAQTTRKLYRIGWLRQGEVPISQTFWDAMRAFGWIEGKNVTVESRYATTADQLPALAKELAQLKLDAIMTDGTPATRAAKAATETIPIVFSIGADPVRQGFVTSLPKPGGNLTGFTFGSYEDKQLEVIKQALPGISRVAYPIRELDPVIVRAAAALGLEAQAIRVIGPDELASFFQAVRSRGVDAVVFPNIAWTGPHESRIAAEAIKVGVPLIGTWRSIAVAGALLAYGPKTDYWPRLAVQVDKIFRGAKPADLAVELPTKFDLVVNLKTAKLLGVSLPQSFLLRVDEVIE
jgi:putative tryptophan/tyrosine transport system substrate-binding protein